MEEYTLREERAEETEGILLLNRWGFIPLIFVFLAAGVMADVQTLGTFKQGECVELSTICADCTYVNLTTVILPNSTVLSYHTNMTKSGTSFTYSFCNTNQLGEYIYNTLGDPEGTDTVQPVDFTVTPSGFGRLGSGEGLSMIGALAVIALIGVALLFAGFKSENVVSKTSFFSFAFIIFIIEILYTVILIQQSLWGYDSIITGIENFWFVMKIGAGLSVTLLFIVIFLVSLKAWKIKRGYIDI